MYKYTHGGNANFESDKTFVDLSANINPFGFPDGVEEAIITSIKNISVYPDNFNIKLIEKISKYENVDKNNIFCSNGASDIIFRIPRILNAKKVLLLSPTFSDYERAVVTNGGEVIYYDLKEKNGFRVMIDILEIIENYDFDLIFICNPNNPTGVVTEFELMKKIIELCKKQNTFIVVDECFIDFLEEKCSVKSLLKKYDNLLILKAFTKIFGLAAIRLGYVMTCNRDIIDKLYMYGGDWPVSNLAQSAGIACLHSPEKFLQTTVEYIKKERENIIYELSKLGLVTFNSRANYIFFKSKENFNLKEKLDLAGIRIRHCNNYHGLNDNYYRVGISSSENNRLFIRELKAIFH